jgi:ABC-type Fe3+-hydroxamate transport system substrate-binding protein
VSVVSLVPSVTETLLAFGVEPVACTRFCEQPQLRHVGGTKNPDTDAIIALAPDLVVVNDEENRIEDVEILRAAGLALHDMSPRSVREVGPAVCALARAVGVEPPDPFPRWESWLAGESEDAGPRRRAFVAIWRRPWMTISADTFGSSMLDCIGWDNVYAAAPERYPTVSLEEVAATGPDAVLLPSEPYTFRPEHADEVRAAVPGAAVVEVDGQDLFWWGIRTPGAIARLRRALSGICARDPLR